MITSGTVVNNLSVETFIQCEKKPYISILCARDWLHIQLLIVEDTISVNFRKVPFDLQVHEEHLGDVAAGPF